MCPDPKTEPERFITDLKDNLASTRYDLLLPFIDASTLLICRHQDEISSRAPILVPDLQSFMVGFNKAETFRLARKLKIPMPATEFPECADEAFQIAERMHYPLVIKPRISPAPRGLRVVTGFEQSASSTRLSIETILAHFAGKLMNPCTSTINLWGWSSIRSPKPSRGCDQSSRC